MKSSRRWRCLRLIQTRASSRLAAMKAVFNAANIEIPFPQRDLHLRSVDPLAGVLLGGPPGAGASPG